MPTLYFIRHGETEANTRGILTGRIETDLTQKGIDDAKKLSKDLKENFNAYYCSPLTRTHQTLKALKGNVDFIIDERVNEVSSGDWQGLLKKDLPLEYELYKKGEFDAPNGERLEDVRKRTKSFLKDMFKLYKKDDKILIVTHNAFLRNLKSLFNLQKGATEPKNLEIFVVDEKMYKNLK